MLLLNPTVMCILVGSRNPMFPVPVVVRTLWVRLSPLFLTPEVFRLHFLVVRNAPVTVLLTRNALVPLTSPESILTPLDIPVLFTTIIKGPLGPLSPFLRHLSLCLTRKFTVSPLVKRAMFLAEVRVWRVALNVLPMNSAVPFSRDPVNLGLPPPLLGQKWIPLSRIILLLPTVVWVVLVLGLTVVEMNPMLPLSNLERWVVMGPREKVGLGLPPGWFKREARIRCVFRLSRNPTAGRVVITWVLPATLLLPRGMPKLMCTRILPFPVLRL